MDEDGEKIWKALKVYSLIFFGSFSMLNFCVRIFGYIHFRAERVY